MKISKEVHCDLCGENYTFSHRIGGMIYKDKSVCPTCSKDFLRILIKNKEVKMITSYCPANMEFREYIKSKRK